YREKYVIKQTTYNSIVQALKLEKGKKSDLLSAKFVFWAKSNFVLSTFAGIEIVCSLADKKPVCLYESLFNIVSESHIAVSHGGRDKTFSEICSHYSFVPRVVVEIFLKQCTSCQVRKPIKQHVVAKPIISLGVLTRLQIDLIDMRTRPDQDSNGVVFQWILHCGDHFSKYCWAFALKNKCASEVALKLRDLFFLFGPPRLLHCDNGREFVANVIFELKKLFPDMGFVRGRPRHPQSQGCIERANGVLCDALGKWLCTNNSSHWSEGLLPVIYGINTRVSSVTKKSPYEVLFDQAPRSDSEFWKIIDEKKIVDEEDLPSPVDDADNMVIGQLDSSLMFIMNAIHLSNSHSNVPSTSSPHIYDPEIRSTITLLDELSELIAPILPSSSSSNKIRSRTFSDVDQPSSNLSFSRHDPIRHAATDNYLRTVTKKQKKYDEHLLNLEQKFVVNDCVGVRIDTVDRTNTDPKLLPCLIVAKSSKDGTGVFRLACQYGKLLNLFPVQDLVDLKSSCPQELRQTDVNALDNVTFIEACKLYARGSVSGSTCDCKSKCATKHCPCKKAGVPCSTKCHSKRGQCNNIGE
ncbi:unnamed protein product, partial [Didymodactylos carnosus]